MPPFRKFVLAGSEFSKVENMIKQKKIQIPLAENRGLLSICLHK